MERKKRMGILLCEQNFREVWRRNENIRAEIGQILRTHTRGSISSKDGALKKTHFILNKGSLNGSETELDFY